MLGRKASPGFPAPLEVDAKLPISKRANAVRQTANRQRFYIRRLKFIHMHELLQILLLHEARAIGWLVYGCHHSGDGLYGLVTDL